LNFIFYFTVLLKSPLLPPLQTFPNLLLPSHCPLHRPNLLVNLPLLLHLPRKVNLRLRPRRDGRNLPPAKTPLGRTIHNANLLPPSWNLGYRRPLKKSKFMMK